MGQDDFSEQLDEIKKVIENNNNNFITNESLDTKLKEFAKSLKQEERDEAAPNSIKDTEGKRLLTEAKASEELIDHYETCTDNSCGIHEMKDKTQVEAFSKGFLLAKKLGGKN